MWLTPTASGERSPEGLPEGRNEDASGALERRLDGSGVRFPAGERSLASEAKVAQELPSNPSGAVTHEKPGEKASTGTREYVVMLKHKLMILTKGGSTPRSGPSLLLLFNF